MTHPILTGNASQVADEVRRAASECQSVVARLTERDQIDPRGMASFTSKMADILSHVTRDRDAVTVADRNIKKLRTNDRDIRRYGELFNLIQEAEDDGNLENERRYRRDLAAVTRTAAPKLAQIKNDVRTSLTNRLRLLRHWWWFVRQAISFYEMLGDAIAANLVVLQRSLPSEDELVGSISALLLSRPDPQTPPSISAGDLPDDSQAIRGEVMKEISLLVQTQDMLEKAKVESNELGNTEALLQEEIQQSEVSESPLPSFEPFLDAAPGEPTPATSGRMARTDRKS